MQIGHLRWFISRNSWACSWRHDTW